MWWRSNENELSSIPRKKITKGEPAQCVSELSELRTRAKEEEEERGYAPFTYEACNARYTGNERKEGVFVNGRELPRHPARLNFALSPL